MNSWHSYSQIFHLGHAAVADLLKGPVYVEEKIDGSQFAFGIDEEGTLRVRSKGCEMVVDAPEKMFSLAVETVKRLKPLLHPGWTYRCEYLRSPKHNVLIYSRIPKDHLIIFDVETNECEFLDYPSKWEEAKRLGLEVVPLLWGGPIETVEQFRDFLQIDSVLGGQKIEGVVVKPDGYNLFGKDKKVLMGKFVSEAFKETHAHVWKQGNPGTKDIIERIISKYATPARWQKAVIHLREKGLITNAPQDIPLIMKEVIADTLLDSSLDIQQELLDYAWPHVQRGLTRGLPEWWKETLLKKQFEKEPSDAETPVDEETGC
jgi:RNA ligase-like protein